MGVLLASLPPSPPGRRPQDGTRGGAESRVVRVGPGFLRPLLKKCSLSCFFKMQCVCAAASKPTYSANIAPHTPPLGKQAHHSGGDWQTCRRYRSTTSADTSGGRGVTRNFTCEFAPRTLSWAYGMRPP